MSDLFVLCEVILAAVVFICNLLQAYSVVSLAFALGFVFLAAYLFLSGITRRTNIVLLLLIVTSLISVIISGALTNDVTLGFGYFKKLIFFFSSIIYFRAVTQVTVKDRTVVWIRRIIMGMMLFLVFDYYVLHNRVMLGRYVTYGFSNPNFTAMWLLHLALFMFCYMVSSRRLAVKPVYLALFVFLIVIIIPTQNRSCLIVMAFFAVMVLLGLFTRRYRLPRVLLAVLLLVPLLCYLLYRPVINSAAFNQMFSFAVSKGKGLDSRIMIWDYAGTLLKNGGWIIGRYAALHFENTTGMLQMHNSHLDILVSYGIIPFILFMKLHYDILTAANERVESFGQYVAFCGFLTVVMLGAFEAGIYAGCTSLNFLTGTYLVLAGHGLKAKEQQ